MNDETLTKKYPRIYLFTAFLHIVYATIFFYSDSKALLYLNIFSIVYYIALALLAKYWNKLDKVFFLCFLEIMLFSITSSILCGWNSGFMMYLYGLMPLTFYSINKFNNNNKKMIVTFSTIILGSFYATMLICFTDKFQIYYLDSAIEKLAYTINISLSLIIMLGFLFVYLNKLHGEQKELSKENEDLNNTANYDTLTGLLNRRTFDACIETFFKYAEYNVESFSLLMCDIDDFKKVNDTYGHDCGDKVLINVANTLKHALRETDIIFRWGGEELLILLAGPQTATPQIAERCRASIENMTTYFNNQEINVTLTIGVCAYYKGITKDIMISTADEKLYEGKHNGKNQVRI